MKTRRELLEEFLIQDPNDSFSRYALGLELLKEGRDAEALKEFQEVLARDPKYVPVYYQLGRLLARIGRVEEARETYQRGAEEAQQAADQRTRTEILEALDSLD